MHELHQTLLAAAAGRFPAVDGAVEVLAPMPGDHHGVVEFTGHSVVLTDRKPEAVAQRRLDGFGGASQPDVLRWLAGPTGWIGSHDAVLAARGVGGGCLGELDIEDHPRVQRSRAHRRDVRVYGDHGGLVTIGRGLVGRSEVSVEAFQTQPPGTGRRLIRAALTMVPDGQVVFAQVAPGNAASLRAFLSCGFVPIGAETLLRPDHELSPPLLGRDMELEHGRGVPGLRRALDP